MSTDTSPVGDGVARTLQLLDVIARHADAGIGVREAAIISGISRSTASRVLRRLAIEGFARLDGDARYHPGPRLYEFTATVQANSSPLAAAAAVMKDIVETLNESVYFCILIPQEFAHVPLQGIECTHALRYVIPTERSPLHAGAAGKAILAFMPPETLDRIELTRFTDSTITDRQQLEAELAEVRELGYAISHRERFNAGGGFAAPVFDDRGEAYGSLVITTPLSRFPDDTAPFIEAVTSGAAKLNAGFARRNQEQVPTRG